MEWIPQSVYSLSFNWRPGFPVNDIWEATSSQPLCRSRQDAMLAGRPERRALERTDSSRQSLAPCCRKHSSFLVISPYMLKKEMGEYRRERGGCSGGAFLPQKSTAVFSACVNKARLNCLIILCNLWDQGIYWKPPSKRSAERLWPTSPEDPLLPPHALIPNQNQAWCFSDDVSH